MTKHQKPHFTGFQFFRKWGIYEIAEGGIIKTRMKARFRFELGVSVFKSRGVNRKILIIF